MSKFLVSLFALIECGVTMPTIEHEPRWIDQPRVA
jgi:hypothetical protein